MSSRSLNSNSDRGVDLSNVGSSQLIAMAQMPKVYDRQLMRVIEDELIARKVDRKAVPALVKLSHWRWPWWMGLFVAGGLIICSQYAVISKDWFRQLEVYAFGFGMIGLQLVYFALRQKSALKE